MYFLPPGFENELHKMLTHLVGILFLFLMQSKENKLLVKPPLMLNFDFQPESS